MTDPERDYLLQRIAGLERSRRRWRVAFLSLLALVVLPVVLGGLLGIAWAQRLEEEQFEVFRQITQQAAWEEEHRRKAAWDAEQRQKAAAEKQPCPAEGEEKPR